MINEAKEELEETLRHNDVMREEEHVHINAMWEEERVRMAPNTIIISSEYLSLDDSLETSTNESYGSGRRQIPTRPMMSSKKSSTFTAKHKSDNEETHLKHPHQDAFTSKQEIL